MVKSDHNCDGSQLKATKFESVGEFLTITDSHGASAAALSNETRYVAPVPRYNSPGASDSENLMSLWASAM